MNISDKKAGTIYRVGGGLLVIAGTVCFLFSVWWGAFVCGAGFIVAMISWNKRRQAPKPSANLSLDAMRLAIPRLQARVRELHDLDVSSIKNGSDKQVMSLQGRVHATLASIYGEGTREFERLELSCYLDTTDYMGLYVNLGGVREIREGVDHGRNRAVVILEGESQSMMEILRHLPPPTNDIFVVHGQDDSAKVEVARVIERAGLNAVILHEQPNEGRTIIEKFEDHGSAAGFAVVVITPDDIGGREMADLKPRARQNVIGEMFWFAGKLGRKRVCALKKGEVELPSDFAGVGYSVMDHAGAWKAALLRELEAAGYSIDWPKALV